MDVSQRVFAWESPLGPTRVARAGVREMRMSRWEMVLCAALVLGVAMMLVGMWIAFPS
jgi:hypothetical protein